MLDYEGDLEKQVGLPVQVVILNDAPPDLAHRVLRDGRVEPVERQFVLGRESDRVPRPENDRK